MKFDFCIGNPPYQELVANNSGSISQANPVYHYFVQQAISITTGSVCMITPSLWMTSGTGLDEFRNFMLTKNHISFMCDFENASDVFPNISLAGGVSYFIYDDRVTAATKYTYVDSINTETSVRDMAKHGTSFFIRDPKADKILEKIGAYEPNFESFMGIVSTYSPFANGKVGNYKQLFKSSPDKNSIKIYRFSRNKEDGKYAYINRNEIISHADWIDKHKIMVSKAGEISARFNGLPFYAEPGTACNETYLVVGPFKDKKTCENVLSYMNTNLYKYLILQIKKSQNAARTVYKFVPMQDFSTSWSDKDLYKKYKLTEEEIAYIESKTN